MATLADIRGLARIYSDQDASDFPTDAQYNLIIGAAANRVWYDLLKAGWPIDFQTANITANGSTTYTLGVGNVAAVRGVYRSDNNGLYRLYRINEGKRAELMSMNAFSGFAEYYDVRTPGSGSAGVLIELLPKASGGTYLVHYLQDFSGFAIDITPWPGPVGSDELVAIKAAEMACRKESRIEDARELKAEYSELLNDIVERANWINMMDPPQIRDVMSSKPRSTFDYPVAGPGGSYDW